MTINRMIQDYKLREFEPSSYDTICIMSIIKPYIDVGKSHWSVEQWDFSTSIMQKQENRENN